VPTKIIPRMVIAVTNYQLLCGLSLIRTNATTAENVGAAPTAVTVAIAIPVECTALKKVS